MDKLVTALTPVFAAGFAVQQLLEIVSPVLDALPQAFQKNKKAILGLISLGIGLALAFGVDALRVLQPLLPTANVSPLLDHVVTALVISAGTEGVNSILKFVKYAKEDKKNEAAQRVAPAPGTAASLHSTHEDALAAVNRK